MMMMMMFLQMILCTKSRNSSFFLYFLFIVTVVTTTTTTIQRIPTVVNAFVPIPMTTTTGTEWKGGHKHKTIVQWYTTSTRCSSSSSNKLYLFCPTKVMDSNYDHPSTTFFQQQKQQHRQQTYDITRKRDLMLLLSTKQTTIRTISDDNPEVQQQQQSQEQQQKQKKTNTQNQQPVVVLYQRVLRPPTCMNGNHILFLNTLIDYIQQQYELPNQQLPMIYQKTIPTSSIPNQENNDYDDPFESITTPTTSKTIEKNNNNNINNNKYHVVCFHSPLSPVPTATTLNVQVIGIVTDNDRTDTTAPVGGGGGAGVVPSMAMIIIEKSGSSSSTSSSSSVSSSLGVLERLFQDSEKKIIKHLDRQLDEEFIKYCEKQQQQVQQRSNTYMNHNDNDEEYGRNNNDEAMLSELLSDWMDDNNEDDDNEKNNRKKKTTKTKVNKDTNTIDADFSMIEKVEITKNNKSNHNKNNNDDVVVLNSSSSSKQTQPGNENNKVMMDPKLDGMDKQQEQGQVNIPSETTTPSSSSSVLSYEEKRMAVLKSMNVLLDPPTTLPMQTKATSTTDTTNSNSLPTGLQFAIQAAKEIAERKRKKEQTQTQPQSVINQNIPAQPPDYAVAMAVAAATKGKQKKSHDDEKMITTNADTTDSDNDKDNNNDMEQKQLLDFSTQRPPMINSKIKCQNRAFMASISTPKNYQKKQQQEQQQSEISTNGSNENEKVKKRSKVSRKESQVTAKESVDRLDKELGDVMQGQANTEKSLLSGQGSGNIKDDQTRFKDGNNEDDVIAQSIQDALNEIADSGQEMTPEELLADIMKFDQQQEHEKQPGSGFVTGAYEKAKDLLREQKVVDQSLRETNKILTDTTGTNEKFTKILSPDEELRRMFEAGERLAEGRIELSSTKAKHQRADLSKEMQQENVQNEIDSIIDSDTSVSRYARVLDDDLVELQVRINKSPGEALDGPDKNPLFDIFSGPEVYNRNVDPETSVNWPGAIPGSKTIRLPKELHEAVKQAKFAAEVLLSIQEITDQDEKTIFQVGQKQVTPQQIRNMRSVVEEAVEIGLIENPLEILAEKSRLQLVLDELRDQPEERFRDIVSNFNDLLLSDYFVPLVKVHLRDMAQRDLDALRNDDDTLEPIHAAERDLLGKIVAHAQLLIKEARALGAELEVQQLEIVRSICKVAMDPSYQTEEEAAMALTDAVRDMRPLFDEAFVAYLKYAVAEEEGKLARAGLLMDPEHNQWLYVLKIVQQGVYAELARGINRYIEHIWYVIRMESSVERRRLLEELINVMPTLDVRPFVQVVRNIVGSLGDGVRGEFDYVTPLGELSNKLLQLHRDVKELLPPERIAEKSRDADEWIEQQRKRLLEQRTLTKQRLRSAGETEQYDEQIEAFGTSGEYDRFD